jgi:hypothetical protein
MPMHITEESIGHELRRYIAEESLSADDEAGRFIDDRFFQLDEENPELSKFTRHMIAIISEDTTLGELAKECSGRYLFMFATILHNADKPKGPLT